jgi:hypothetical protein
VSLNASVYAAMFGFPILSLAIFGFLKPRRALLAVVVLGWLFLPEAPHAEFKIPGLPLYTKVVAISYSALLGALIFDTRRALSFRPGWVDLPMAVFCLSPFVTYVLNDFPPMEGLSCCMYTFFTWGAFYYLARIYLVRMEGLKDLAIAIFFGGLVYAPLCLFEIRMSPVLHIWVYGYHQHSFDQTVRFGGWRPTVFMSHGIVVGMWMSMATLMGFWLWHSGTLKTIGRYSTLYFLVPLAITTVLCKSFGSLILLVVGAGVLLLNRGMPGRTPLLLLAAVAPLYVIVRVAGWWSGEDVVSLAVLVDPDRGSSFEFRLKNEDLLTEKALRRPFFGWGGWGRNRVYDSTGRDISVTDGFWIAQMGALGLVGLAALFGWVLVPIYVLQRKIPPRFWSTSWGAAPAVLAVLCALFLIDWIPNATCNPVFILAAGALSGMQVIIQPRPVRTQRAMAPRVAGAERLPAQA